MAKITDTPYTFHKRESASAAGDMTALGWDLFPTSVGGDHEIWRTEFTEDWQPLHSWLDAVNMVNELLSFETKILSGTNVANERLDQPEIYQTYFPLLPVPTKDDTLFSVKKIRQMRNALRSLYPNLVLEKLSDNIHCSKRMLFDMLRARWFQIYEVFLVGESPPFTQIAGTNIQNHLNNYIIDFGDDVGPRAVGYMSSDPTPPAALIEQWKSEDNIPGGSSINPVVLEYEPMRRGQDLVAGPHDSIVTSQTLECQLYEVVNGEIVTQGEAVDVTVLGTLTDNDGDGGGDGGTDFETPQ